MDFNEIDSIFSNEYFQLIKKLQLFVGLWPYKTGFDRLFRRCTVCIFIILTIIPCANAVRLKCGTDIAICCENLLGVIYLSVVSLKYIITSLSEAKLKIAYEQIAIGWSTVSDPIEKEIIRQYAEQGRLKALFYFLYSVCAGILFVNLPLIPVLLDYIIPLNESREKILFIKAEYIIDPYKYYYELYLFFVFDTSIILATFSSIDTTYTVIVHQNLGIIAVIMQKLKTATLNKKLDAGYIKIIETIKLHKDVLNFIDLVESAYSFLFLLVMGATIIGISISALIFPHLKAFDSFRLFAVLSGCILHLLYLSWPGQMILDHSQDLFVSIYTTEWYNVSQKAKVLLKIMMLRCMKLSKLTAGGLYVMNFENFGSIIKTTLSYVTVAMSFQE